MRAQLLDQDVFEVAVLAFAEELPYVLVAKSSEGRNLQFEKVVLRGVEVDGVDSAWVRETEGQDVVTCGADSKDNIVSCGLQDSMVCNIVLPGEGVDVRVVESSMFEKCRVVVDAPMVVLVPSSW